MYESRFHFNNKYYFNFDAIILVKSLKEDSHLDERLSWIFFYTNE